MSALGVDALGFLSGSPEECCDCETRHDASEDFNYRGFHFCINCMSEFISWFLDGGTFEDSDRYDWMGLADLVTPFEGGES